jgi:hypothetical protein
MPRDDKRSIKSDEPLRRNGRYASTSISIPTMVVNSTASRMEYITGKPTFDVNK